MQTASPPKSGAEARHGPRGLLPGAAVAVPQAQHLPPQLSMVIPTRNEADNIEPLVRRLEAALPDLAVELIFVDDSDDETVAVIQRLAAASSTPIVLAHRPRGERANGLGGAVTLGLLLAQAPWVCVMDADLQHPPELVPTLFAQAAGGELDLVIASRYCDQGNPGGLNAARWVVSQASTHAARLLFPRRLRDVSDPLSGFFLVRQAALELEDLQPRGFKILLEILGRTPQLRIAEVGFTFAERHAGKSKASLQEGLRYLTHLLELRFDDTTLRMLRFLSVGLTGLLVNLLLLALFTERGSLHYLASAVLATQGSTLWNFLLTEHWVFRRARERQGRGLRLALFFTMNNLALLLRGPMLVLLTSTLGLYYLLSNGISLVALTLVRYAFADRLIWRAHAKQKGPTLYTYNIHGIVTVSSDAALPELEQFMTAEQIDTPTLRVRIEALPRRRARAAQASAAEARSILFDDHIGRFGFWINVMLGKTIEIAASPLLARSPHVLYTNVVEPILRWTFVEKGYALVHGACLTFGDEAHLVTARTDTGKTTTILRVLDRQRRASDQGAFISDDLTLITAEGQVLTYPKPLTISHHTVQTINSALLSWRERAGLRLQSRIHSRSGRRFALFLSRTRLPVATINAVIQLLIPPPKYHVQRLVPGVKFARQAKLAGLFVIERGGDEMVALDHAEALSILMRNCEDAYGFPPYQKIEHFLRHSAAGDLRQAEHQIVSQALQGIPGTLLKSSHMDWSDRILSLTTRYANQERRPRVGALVAEPVIS